MAWQLQIHRCIAFCKDTCTKLITKTTVPLLCFFVCLFRQNMDYSGLDPTRLEKKTNPNGKAFFIYLKFRLYNKLFSFNSYQSRIHERLKAMLYCPTSRPSAIVHRPSARVGLSIPIVWPHDTTPQHLSNQLADWCVCVKTGRLWVEITPRVLTIFITMYLLRLRKALHVWM